MFALSLRLEYVTPSLLFTTSVSLYINGSSIPKLYKYLVARLIIRLTTYPLPSLLGITPSDISMQADLEWSIIIFFIGVDIFFGPINSSIFWPRVEKADES